MAKKDRFIQADFDDAYKRQMELWAQDVLNGIKDQYLQRGQEYVEPMYKHTTPEEWMTYEGATMEEDGPLKGAIYGTKYHAPTPNDWPDNLSITSTGDSEHPIVKGMIKSSDYKHPYVSDFDKRSFTAGTDWLLENVISPALQQLDKGADYALGYLPGFNLMPEGERTKSLGRGLRTILNGVEGGLGILITAAKPAIFPTLDYSDVYNGTQKVFDFIEHPSQYVDTGSPTLNTLFDLAVQSGPISAVGSNAARIGNNWKNRNIISYHNISPASYDNFVRRGSNWLQDMIFGDVSEGIRDMTRRNDIFTRNNPKSKVSVNYDQSIINGYLHSANPKITPEMLSEYASIARDESYRKYLGLPENYNIYTQNAGTPTWSYNLEELDKIAKEVGKRHGVDFSIRDLMFNLGKLKKKPKNGLTHDSTDSLTGSHGRVERALEETQSPHFGNPIYDQVMQYKLHRLFDQWSVTPFNRPKYKDTFTAKLGLDKPLQKLSKAYNYITKQNIDLAQKLNKKFQKWDAGYLLGAKADPYYAMVGPGNGITQYGFTLDTMVPVTSMRDISSNPTSLLNPVINYRIGIHTPEGYIRRSPEDIFDYYKSALDANYFNNYFKEYDDFLNNYLNEHAEGGSLYEDNQNGVTSYEQLKYLLKNLLDQEYIDKLKQQAAYNDYISDYEDNPQYDNVQNYLVDKLSNNYYGDVDLNNMEREIIREALAQDPSTFDKGGKIHIKEKNKGKFSAAAKRAGMSTQAYASHVLANKNRYSPTLVKRANFARNASKWKHSYGGPLIYAGHQGYVRI